MSQVNSNLDAHRNSFDISKHLSELCMLLVEENMGKFFAHIFAVLTVHGQQTALELAQRARLSLKQIRTGLAALIQLRLVYYHTSAESWTTYEANLCNAYNLVRLGKVIALARERLGDDAAAILTKISLAGQLKVRDIRQILGSRDGHLPAESSKSHNATLSPLTGCNGYSSRLAPPESVLTRLAQGGFILQSREAYFNPAQYNPADGEARVLTNEPVMLNMAWSSRRGIAGEISTEMETHQDACIRALTITSESRVSLKRSAADQANFHTKKKPKLSCENVQLNTPRDNSGEDYDGDVVLHVNCANIAVMIRNRQLFGAVRRRFGKHIAESYAAVLRQFQSEDQPQQNQWKPTPDAESTTRAKQRQIKMDELLTAFIAQNSFGPDGNSREGDFTAQSSGKQAFSRESEHNHLNGQVDDSLPDEVRKLQVSSKVEKQLQILSEDPSGFVTQEFESRMWMIDFHRLSQQLKRDEVFDLINNRLDNVALRIVRVLVEHGRVEEKFLQETCLLPARELRRYLARLEMFGLVELQEIPREPQRQPTRTIFLWYYDSDRVSQMLLGDLYKAMSKLLRRLNVERQRVGELLGKAERSDVKGQEERLLTRSELEMLHVWQRREEWLITELNRLDDSVAILRDI